ncbi:MAG TPA: YHS domain-containing protein [Bryobacteraceae bacterium]|jgi:Cu+-exporting ATPase|nr:YHS domain-containing protein [Bryobacteraceae bacterium]
MADYTVVDPVCGTRLDSSRTQFTSDYEGMRYYFCSENCKHRFDHDPEAYLHSGLTATNTSE